MRSGDENREPLRFAEDDDSDDLGGFSRGKRSYEDEEDEENGGWAINEDHSDRLWDSAEDVDEDDDDAVVVEGEEVEEDDEEEADLFGGGAPRGRRGRPKGSTNANREKAAMGGSAARDTGFGATGGSLFDDQTPAATTPSREISTAATPASTAPKSTANSMRKATSASSDGKRPVKKVAAPKSKSAVRKPAAKKVTQVGRQEWNPETQRASLQREPFGNQINGEPVRDEEPDRIGQRLAQDDAPGLFQAEQLARAGGS